MARRFLLCVDDDSTVLSCLQTLLCRALGPEIEVELAQSGQEALALCAELAHEGREPAVVMSDFIMPHMRGDELLVRVHALHPRAVTLMLTGQSALDGIQRAVSEAGLFSVLAKPFDNAELLHTVLQALAAYRPAEA